MPGPVSRTPSSRSYDDRAVWDWVVIAGCYAFAAFFLHLLGGFNSAGEAMARWGRHVGLKRLSRTAPPR